MRHVRIWVALAGIGLAACGGGSTSDQTTSGSGGGKPKATRTPTPVAAPQTLYVRVSGDDANPGTSPDMALKTIAAVAKILHAGATVYVGPGTYRGRVEITNKTGTEDLPIRIIADRTGVNTQTRPGEVVIDANNDTAGVVITKSPYVSLEGFLITGAEPQDNVAATTVQIRSTSHHVEIRDCLIGNAAKADGIRVNGSSDVLIFDNLIFSNDRGVVITGAAPDARILNNTIVNHLRAGISLNENDGAAPVGATVHNNIIQGNDGKIAISVADAAGGYDGDYNLVFEPDLEDQTLAYNPDRIRGRHDINEDALFANVPQTDVRLTEGSPAINAGTTTIGQDFVNLLLKRSATLDGAVDRTPPDLGYHYPR